MNTFDTFDPFDVDIPFTGQREPSTVQVVNLRTSIPEPDLAERRKLVTYGEKAWPRLTKQDCWSIAHAVADPATANTVAKAGVFSEQFAGDSALTFLRADVNLPFLIPIIQPRTADVPTLLAPPRVHGVLDGRGEPRPVMIVEFQSKAHMREYTKHSIARTLEAGRDLKSSILSHGVSQPVLCYAATIRLLDTGEEIDVIVVVDGLTRVVMSWAAMLGGTVTAAGLPGAIVDRIFSKKGSDGGTDGVSGAFRKGRTEQFGELRGNFLAAAGDTTDPNLTRYGQTVRVPANIIVNFRRVGKPLVGEARLYEFPDAVNSAVAQQHSLSKAWAPSAIGANIGGQAIQRAAAAGILPAHVAGVALGVEDFSFADVTLMDPDGGLPEIDLGLARGVWMGAELTQPAVFEAVKRSLRALGGDPQIHKRNYADRISTPVCRAWAPWKLASHSNEQRAWAAGGAIPHSLIGTSWTPLFPKMYTDLVPIALATDDPRQGSAVATLQCAGGMALVADGQILAASGSTAEGAQARYRRSQPPVVVEELAATVEGLWLLAHAADSFQSDKQAVNSFTKAADIPPDAYRIQFPEPGNPVRGVGVHEGARLSFDHVRDIAGLRLSDNDDEDDDEDEDGHDRLIALRSRLTAGADAMQRAQEALTALAGERPDLKPFDSYPEWESVQQQLSSIFAVVMGWKPPESIASYDADGDSDGDEDADEL
jgi:hypothetical protein